MPLRIVIDRELVAAFCSRWQIREFAIFGSALREDFCPASDVDVLVDLQPQHGLDLYDWVDMIAELEALFGRKVHLVAKTGLRNPYRRREILRTAEVVHAA